MTLLTSESKEPSLKGGGAHKSKEGELAVGENRLRAFLFNRQDTATLFPLKFCNSTDYFAFVKKNDVGTPHTKDSKQ